MKEFEDEPRRCQSYPSRPEKLIGTPLYCAVSVLKGEPHSRSTDLESLYYSLRHIAYGKLPDESGFKRAVIAQDWADTRHARCSALQTFADDEYAPFMQALHDLFWPAVVREGKRFTSYIHDSPTAVVPTATFQAVCIWSC